MRLRPGLRPGPHWGSSRGSPRPRSRLGRGIPIPHTPHPRASTLASLLGACGSSILAPSVLAYRRLPTDFLTNRTLGPTNEGVHKGPQKPSYATAIGQWYKRSAMQDNCVHKIFKTRWWYVDEIYTNWSMLTLLPVVVDVSTAPAPGEWIFFSVFCLYSLAIGNFIPVTLAINGCNSHIKFMLATHTKRLSSVAAAWRSVEYRKRKVATLTTNGRKTPEEIATNLGVSEGLLFL